jgi:hypothetical protein
MIKGAFSIEIDGRPAHRDLQALRSCGRANDTHPSDRRVTQAGLEQARKLSFTVVRAVAAQKIECN